MSRKDALNRLNQLQGELSNISKEIESIKSLVAGDETIDDCADHDWSRYIVEVLKDMGVPCNLLGWGYLKEALRLTLENPHKACHITGYLYPEVADIFTTTSSAVERSMRHAIHRMWNVADDDTKIAYFGAHIARRGSAPTVSEFLSFVSERLKKDYHR